MKDFSIKFIIPVFIIAILLCSAIVLRVNNSNKQFELDLLDTPSQEEVQGITSISTWPIITNIAPTNAYIGVEYLYDLSIMDSDTSITQLQVKLTQAPEWLYVEDFRIYGTPDFGSIGTHKVTIKVSDGENTTFKSYYIVVQAYEENN